jgi:oxygen-dependent protoporphyrinogen oxidase
VRVAVVGGGIAGLVAARRLEAAAPDVDVVLVERDEVLGGKIRTERVGGFVIEAAPDSFLSRKERGVGLCEELGLSDQLIGRKPENHHSFVRRGRDLHPLPEGLTGMIPTNLDALERSALLSDEGKTRFAAEVAVPAAFGEDDESVASFVTRRFGREAYDGLVEPLMTGIYGGDGELLSLRATFPQLRVLELERGSLLSSLPAQSGPRDRPPFVALRGGMDTLVSALVAKLGRTRLLLGRPVARVLARADGYDVELEVGETIRADGVVVATPAFATAAIIEELDADLAAVHAEIPYASSVVVTFAFSAHDVTPLDGYGYVIPRAESLDVLACTWTSQKWDDRAPDGAVLVRVYAGRFGGRDLTLHTDDELVALALEELALVAVTAEPALIRVQRWPLGMPQYVLGHLERLDRIEAALAEHPGLAVAGAAYRGVGLPDCIRSGETAAESVVRALAGAGV